MSGVGRQRYPDASMTHGSVSNARADMVLGYDDRTSEEKKGSPFV